MDKNYDYIVIGAGIVGLASAYQLQQKGIKKILVIDKEKEVATHQSSHNSGVVHAGVYYPPKSLKARFCKNGVQAITDFCEKYQLPFSQTGKLIVATNAQEHERMKQLYQRAKLNGIEINEISADDIKKLEPNINAVAGLLSPKTAITDYQAISQKIKELLIESGGQVLLGEQVIAASENNKHVSITTEKQTIYAEKVVICAGLHSDRMVKLFGLTPDYQVVPFRGEFFKIDHQPHDLVKHLIYPVPDPERPFLGVHITRKTSGIFTVGPNAVLAGAREGYRFSDINIKDLAQAISYKGFWKMFAQNFAPAMTELQSSISRRTYLKRIQKYCPHIKLEDLKPYPAGVRAQAVSFDGTLIDDFKFIESKRTLHVCNAPSPAATACFPIGQYIADKITHSAD